MVMKITNLNNCVQKIGISQLLQMIISQLLQMIISQVSQVIVKKERQRRKLGEAAPELMQEGAKVDSVQIWIDKKTNRQKDKLTK